MAGGRDPGGMSSPGGSVGGGAGVPVGLATGRVLRAKTGVAGTGAGVAMDARLAEDDVPADGTIR